MATGKEVPPAGASHSDDDFTAAADDAEKLIRQKIDAEGEKGGEADQDLIQDLEESIPKRRDAAIRTAKAEKEIEPINDVLKKLQATWETMEKTGLEDDAEIIKDTHARLQIWIHTARENKAELESQTGGQVSMEDLLYPKKTEHQDLQINNIVAIGHTVGDRGGSIYLPTGVRAYEFIDPEELEKPDVKENVDALLEQDANIIDKKLTIKGEQQLLVSLGVIKAGDEFTSMPHLFQEKTRAEMGNDKFEVDPGDYEIRFPTDIEGMQLFINHKDKRPKDDLTERRVGLQFDTERLKKMLR